MTALVLLLASRMRVAVDADPIPNWHEYLRLTADPK